MPSDFDFSFLRTVLAALPLPILQPSTLDFRLYTPSQHGIEKTETVNGAVNDDLESMLGLKVHGLTLCESGPGVVALADVLERYTKEFPDDVVLGLWGPAILAAAENAFISAGKPFPTVEAVAQGAQPAVSHPKSVQALELEGVNDVDADSIPKRTSKKRKTRADSNISSVPPWVDILESPLNCGRPPDLLARRLSILCYDSRDSDKTKKLRCAGSVNGCPSSSAFPRNKTRVYRHASSCTYIDPALRQQASAALSGQAPSALAEQAITPRSDSSTSNQAASTALAAPSSTTSPILELAASSGRQQLKTIVDFDVIRFVCAAGLPPTCVDRPEFKTLLTHLNNRYIPVSSSTLAYNQIPSEAACVLEKTIEILRNESNLTLSLDGGSVRRARSVYTFHVATSGRRIFLMRGEDTSTQSHTGEHIANISRQVMDQIG
ncbi:hypothetical protein BDV93DRAFT_509688 [Ceratobasidium sp. AG-I]|nr:hypothetical protein BDV93DRAFT_509688 [Ceratobasidium sp. AG-I]